MEFDLKADLLEQLPPLYREIEEYQQICRVEESQFEQLESAALSVCRNFFVQTADLDSVCRWENVLRIQAAPASETLAFRQQRILSRLRTRPPYTLAFLHQQLDAMIGPGRWDCQIDYPHYLLRIRSDAKKPASCTELPYLVNQIKPAHIAFRLCLFYDPVLSTAYAAATPCGTAVSYTIRLPGIDPHTIKTQAYAAGGLAHTSETITIKIGGTL